MDILTGIDFKKMLLDRDLYDVSSCVNDKDKPEKFTPDALISLLEPTISLNGPPALIGEELMSDLEVFKGYTSEQATICDKLDQRSCKGSIMYMHKLMSAPTDSLEVLNERKQVLQKLEQEYNVKQKGIDDDLHLLTRCENSVLFFYSSSDEELGSFYDIVYFRVWFLSFLNNSDTALTLTNIYKICISPLIGLLSPLFYFVVPYFVLRMKMNIKMGFITYLKFVYKSFIAGLGKDSIFAFSPTFSKLRYLSYGLSLLFYFQNIFSNIEMARLIYKVSSILTNRVNDMALFTQASKRIIDTLWSDSITNCFWKDTTIQPIIGIEQYCNLKVCQDKHFLLNSFGKQLTIFKSFDKTNYQNILKRMYMIDVLLSMVKAKKSLKLTFANFSNSGSQLVLDGLFHPSIDGSKIVKNNVRLKESKRSMLITGPNAGGKSTFIKAALLSVLLSQTIALVAADSSIITPFHVINSQINIPDCKGKESLFEAEMNRSKKSIEMIKIADAVNKPSIVVMDEIFNSTNPVEGIAGAYAIAKRLAAFDNNITLITTHYVYLTKLKKESNFQNFKMNILRQPDNSIHYPYKLSKGVSQQYIALELLKANGFDQEIVDEALHVRDRLIVKSE